MILCNFVHLGTTHVEELGPGEWVSIICFCSFVLSSISVQTYVGKVTSMQKRLLVGLYFHLALSLSKNARSLSEDLSLKCAIRFREPERFALYIITR